MSQLELAGSAMLRVDAHHHLWNYNAAEFCWLEGDLTTLRRNFLPAELLLELQGANVHGTVAVQARQEVRETDWLLHLAAATPLILGVVGWLPLRDLDFPATLACYKEHTALKGLRHVLQAEPPGFMEDRSFNSGIEALRGTSLVFDILILESQLEEATRFVDRHPDQTFVLDHLAKPKIAAGELQSWANRIRELAQRENVVCKVSGMVTEADTKCWSTSQLKPYFDTVLECFTPSRLMAGSDWPVLCAGCTYPRWWKILSDWVDVLSADEQADILGRTAVKTYGLHPLLESKRPNLEIYS